jgi:hypothetical protein
MTPTFIVKIPILTKEISLIKNKKYNEVDAYLKAKKQVKDIKGFLWQSDFILYCHPIAPNLYQLSNFLAI